MKEIRDRMTPLEIQQAAIGCILLNPECFPLISEYVEGPEVFQDEELSDIYAAMLELRHDGKVPDTHSLVWKLQDVNDGHAAVVAAQCLSVPQTTALAEQYAQILAHDHALRCLANEAYSVAKAAGGNPSIEEITSQAAGMVQEIQRRMSKDRIAKASDFTASAMDSFRAMASCGGIHGMPTGYKELDILIGGINAPDILVVAARPAGGKTAWCVSVALNAAKAGTPVLFVSLEMSREQMVMRMIQCLGGVDTKKVKIGGIFARAEITKAEQAAALLESLPITIIAPHGNMSVNALCGYIRRQRMGTGVGLVVVDYLQLMAGDVNTSSRQEEVSGISRGLKMAAQEFDVPMIVAAQLSRQADGSTPRLSHLRESGAIEQDADRVLFLVPDEKADKNEPMAEVSFDVAKNRHGQTGQCKYAFHRQIQRFVVPGQSPFEEPQAQRHDYDDSVPFDDHEDEVPF